MPKYGKKAQEEVEEAMHELKRGELESGSSGKKVTSKKQAIAIGLSKARKEGGKVPARSGNGRSASRSARRRTAGSQRRAGTRARSRSTSSRGSSRIRSTSTSRKRRPAV